MTNTPYLPIDLTEIPNPGRVALWPSPLGVRPRSPRAVAGFGSEAGRLQRQPPRRPARSLSLRCRTIPWPFANLGVILSKGISVPWKVCYQDAPFPGPPKTRMQMGFGDHPTTCTCLLRKFVLLTLCRTQSLVTSSNSIVVRHRQDSLSNASFVTHTGDTWFCHERFKQELLGNQSYISGFFHVHVLTLMRTSLTFFSVCVHDHL